MYGAKKHRRGRSGRVGNANAHANSAFAPISPTPLAGPHFRQHILPSQFERSQRDPRPNLAPLAKIALPNLKRPRVTDASKSCKKQRASHACNCCRKAKAGCNGEQPCDRCKQASVQCIYSDLKRDDDRKRLSKLSKEIESLTQHKLNVTDSLRRIRSNAKLSSNDMRAAIGKVLDMASVLPYENEEPSDDTRASTDREECAISSAARSTELDFFDSSFDTTTAIQMLGDIGQIHGYYKDPWQHLVTTVAPQVHFSFPIHGRELVHEGMHLSSGGGGSSGMEGFGSQTGFAYSARADLRISEQPVQEAGASSIFACVYV
ncbi:uncharacterized protein RAG0_13644 [Rhynchosporium agropyri]|uniref:Zn(2)-C6 fungal-type domain-containing protein n=1 Tax=Rhynchosporium agropyri TaxID=914238 RepID=A0A1E1LDP0_9HELO|nr:uncharacterized protein RAG0_13644 [Rhynchosporium agropyri]